MIKTNTCAASARARARALSLSRECALSISYPQVWREGDPPRIAIASSLPLHVPAHIVCVCVCVCVCVHISIKKLIFFYNRHLFEGDARHDTACTTARHLEYPR